MRRSLVTLALLALLARPVAAQTDRPIRIGVVESAPAASLTMTVAYRLLDGELELGRFPALGLIDVRTASGSWVVALPDGTSLVATNSLRLRAQDPTPDARAKIANKLYRGDLEVRLASGSLTVVNEVPLDDYLYGVVPAESIPSWDIEALKAQAVAARTYAISRLGQFASLGYDLKATVVNQVYGGASLEKPRTNQAVDDTRGQILTYQGRPIEAVYFDCAGGYTESAAEAWGKGYPYLQSVPDFDQQSPRYVWDQSFTGAQVAALTPKLSAPVGEILDLVPLERSSTGRVRKLKVVGSLGVTEISGDKLRSWLGLRSTYFNVARQPDGTWAFCGRGWGHAVGLSQWGAKALADMGYRYDQILAHYYPSTVLTSWTAASGR